MISQIIIFVNHKSAQSVVHFFNGVGLGLALSILVGPLLFALVQTSLEQGARSGLAVGVGIWISDLLFVAGSYLGLSYLVKITHAEGFEEILGTAGGIFLAGMGLAILLKKTPEMGPKLLPEKRLGYFGGLWLKGFLINTINPFTVFFWTSVSSGLLGPAEKSEPVWLFYAGVMLVIVATDAVKVLAASKMSPYLKPGKLRLMRRISGMALFAFGLGLLIRVWLPA